MSTIDRERGVTVPPLVAGQRLDRPTFHQRYEAMPPGSRFELIGGVVVMPSPVGLDHGDISALVISWLGSYRRGMFGLRVSDNATVILDDAAEAQPDVHLRILPEYGGLTRTEGRYLAGPPEFVVEVARSSREVDLGDKREDYQRAGVPEYLVVTLDPNEVHWFVRRGDQFDRIAPGADGVYRSEVFPGLWLDPLALFAFDEARLLAALDLGRATPEFAAFADRLNEQRPG